MIYSIRLEVTNIKRESEQRQWVHAVWVYLFTRSYFVTVFSPVVGKSSNRSCYCSEAKKETYIPRFRQVRFLCTMFSFVELFVARVAANSPTDVWYVNSSNPLTPTSDLDRISSDNINTISRRQVMRIKRNVNWEISSWSNTKFSKLES